MANYCGFGSQSKYGLKVVINLSEIGEIIEKNGAIYVKLPDSPAIQKREFRGVETVQLRLDVNPRREPANGVTHSVKLDEWEKPTPQPADAPAAAAPEEDDDTPF